MTHMKLTNRQRLGFLAELGWPMDRIAADMGWCAQTITDELRNRRVDSDKRYGCSNRLCAHYEECRLESNTANQVTLHPFLLGQKYQRAADRAILKKNGVVAKKPEANK